MPLHLTQKVENNMQVLTINEIEQVNGGGMIDDSYASNALELTCWMSIGARGGTLVGGPVGTLVGAYVGTMVGLGIIYSDTNFESALKSGYSFLTGVKVGQAMVGA